MPNITIRSPSLNDAPEFLHAMHASQCFLNPWVVTPQSDLEYMLYCQRLENDQAYLGYFVCLDNKIAGVININDIIRGSFLSASMGFYAVADYAGQGVMSAGLKLVLQDFFSNRGLHRLEANIQPDNQSSIQCIQRNGFQKEGFSPRYLKINGEWRDHERWAITQEDWARLIEEV